MKEQAVLNISWGTISKIIVAVIAVYILFTVKDIIVWFIFALVLGILFNYVIDILEKKKIPRILSALLLYLAVFALLGFFIYKTAPILLNEFQDFAKNFPQYLQKISPLFERFGVEAFRNTDALLKTLQANLDKASVSIINAIFSIFGGAASTILVLTMAFFISLEKNFVEKILGTFSPKRHKEHLFRLWDRAKQKVSGWFITRVIGVLFVGGATYLVLSLFNVKYAFILSIMAGLFDLVPIIGPVVAGAVIVSVVALTSLFQALFVAIAFIVIQQLENNLLFPILFKKFLGVSPVLVLIALAVGGKLWGIAGAILAIPLAGVVFEVLKDYLKKLRKDESDSEESTPAVENTFQPPELEL